MWLIAIVRIRLLVLVIVSKISLTDQLLINAKPEIKVDTSSILHTNTLPDSTVCGLKKVDNKVMGGNVTDIGEFPWMVALEYKHRRNGKPAGIRCGGSLINSRYVLIAAHCIKNTEFQLTNVRLGEWNTLADPDCWPESVIDCAEPMRKIGIAEEIPHEYYLTTSKANDIGLLKLEQDIKYTVYIRPICLPNLNLPFPKFGTNLTVAGWGATEHGENSNIALKVEVPLVPNNDCSSLHVRGLTGDVLCAGGEPGKDSCQGDSGGPIMRLYEDTLNQRFRWYQEGLVAYGIACGRARYPGVYTRIRRYIKWILRKIRKN